MFGILRKSKKEQEEPVVVQDANVYPKEVHEIHHAFETAGDNLLKEAEEIINSCNLANLDKSKRLDNLGFTSVKEVVEFKTTLLKKETAEKVANLILQYKVKYPNNKFITPDQVNSICEKWGLVQGEIKRFKGFVPEKNLSDIEKFMLKVPKDTLALSNIRSYGVPAKTYSDIVIQDAVIKEVCGYFHIFNSKIKDRDAFQSSNGVDFYASDSYNIFGLRDLGDVRFTVSSGLSICAPLKDMEVNEWTKKIGNRLVDVPDPVVLYPVEGGYLIVTAWGDEASDPLVVNETQN